jgi:hypothetical protein
MADRLLAQFHIAEPDGSISSIVVAGIRDERPATWEETPSGDLSTAVFYWRSPEVALSVAMSNAGWGHRTERLRKQAAQDTAERIAAAVDQGVTV